MSIAIVRVNWSAPDAKAETTVVISASEGTGSTTRVSVAGPLPPPRIPSQWPQHPQGISSCSQTDTEPLDSVLRPLLYIFYKIFHLTHKVNAASLVLLVQLVLQTCDMYEDRKILRLGVIYPVAVLRGSQVEHIFLGPKVPPPHFLIARIATGYTIQNSNGCGYNYKPSLIILITHHYSYKCQNYELLVVKEY